MDASNARTSRGTAPEIPSCGVYVDEEGDWYFEGNKIIHENILGLLFDSLRLRPDGTYVIEWNYTVCALDAADTVFVVARVDRLKREGANQDSLWLTFKHAARGEPLDAASLWVGKDNVLYCRVGEGRFPARFSRPAYYQLAEWIQEDTETGQFYLELNDRRYTIA